MKPKCSEKGRDHKQTSTWSNKSTPSRESVDFVGSRCRCSFRPEAGGLAASIGGITTGTMRSDETGDADLGRAGDGGAVFVGEEVITT